MKTILLIRHAKSVNHLARASDFTRTLNEQGIKDAAEMANRLVKKNILIDQFVSSPALRAKTTAEIFIDHYNRKPEEILLVPELYQASSKTFDEVIVTLDDQFSRVAIFSHNPGISEYAAFLTTHAIDHIPTCGIYAVAAGVHSWVDFPMAEKTFLFFDIPKNR